MRTTSQTLDLHGKFKPDRKKALGALGFVDQWWTKRRRYCRDQWYLLRVSALTGSWFSGKWACIIALFQATQCNLRFSIFFLFMVLLQQLPCCWHGAKWHNFAICSTFVSLSTAAPSATFSVLKLQLTLCLPPTYTNYTHAESSKHLYHTDMHCSLSGRLKSTNQHISIHVTVKIYPSLYIYI